MEKKSGKARAKERQRLFKEIDTVLKAAKAVDASRGRGERYDKDRMKVCDELWATHFEKASELAERAHALDPPDHDLETAAAKLTPCVNCMPGPDGPCEAAEQALKRAKGAK